MHETNSILSAYGIFDSVSFDFTQSEKELKQKPTPNRFNTIRHHLHACSVVFFSPLFRIKVEMKKIKKKKLRKMEEKKRKIQLCDRLKSVSEWVHVHCQLPTSEAKQMGYTRAPTKLCGVINKNRCCAALFLGFLFSKKTMTESRFLIHFNFLLLWIYETWNLFRKVEQCKLYSIALFAYMFAKAIKEKNGEKNK